MMMHARRLLAPLALAAAMLVMVGLAAADVGDNIAVNGDASTLSGWTTTGAASVIAGGGQSGPYIRYYYSGGVYGTAGQKVTPTASGIWRFYFYRTSRWAQSGYITSADTGAYAAGYVWSEAFNSNSGWGATARDVMLRDGVEVYFWMRNNGTDPSKPSGIDTLSIVLQSYAPSISAREVFTNPDLVGSAGCTTAAPWYYNGQSGHSAIGQLQHTDSSATVGNIYCPMTVTEAGDYTASFWYYLNNGGHIYGVFQYDDPVGGWTNLCSKSAAAHSAWYQYSCDVDDLVAGDYRWWFYNVAYASLGRIDDVSLLADLDPAAEEYWSEDAWVYYPLEQAAELELYKPYTQTASLYGAGYAGYNIWSTTADATAYAIASMDILKVSTNVFGYYVEAAINSWPDVPSTTIKYEGLASVSVAAGQHVSAQCPIGTVAKRNEFSGSVYHLLLGVWYPDTSTAFNPVPWMARRPSPGSCLIVIPPEVITPSGGGLWEPVCRDCVAPSGGDIWSLGNWIDWLGCQITNLILCWMVRLINTVIAWVIGIFNLGLTAMGWLSATINDVIAWATDLWSSTIAPGLAVLLRSGLAVLLQSDLFQMAWSFVRIAWVFFQQTFDLLDGSWDLMELAADVVENLLSVMTDLITHMVAAFTGTKADIFDFFGVDTGLGGDASGIPYSGGSLTWPEFEAAIAASGANQYKALYITVLGVGTADAVIGDTGLVVLTYILMAGVGWSLLTWTLKQFQDIITF